MFKTQKIHPIPLLIGVLLIAISMIGRLTMGSTEGLSLTGRYERALDGICFGAAGVVGGIMLLVLLGLSAVKKPRVDPTCSGCGLVVDRKTENFCRQCGMKL